MAGKRATHGIVYGCCEINGQTLAPFWLNDQELLPPAWTNSPDVRSPEIDQGNENCTARPPLPVHLNKGWNKVFMKLPVGKFTTPEIWLVKWAFTAVFVTPDGSRAVDGLIYSPDKSK